MSKNLLRIISPLLLIAVMISIFCFSAQEATDSGRLSEGFSYKVFSAFYPEFNKMTKEEQQKIIDDTMFPVRKLAHFSLYFLLGAFAFLSIITYGNFSVFLKGIISFGFCVLYSTSDEIHQYFVPGRSCELRDVLIDSCGAFLSILILVVIYKTVSKKRGVR